MNATLNGLTATELAKNILCLSAVDSTNRYLKEQGASLPHGTLCYTDWQQEGKGRLGRSWQAPKGQSLAMSILFRPAEGTALLPLICGLAVTEALEGLTGKQYEIKWPNDIVCSGRKVCGILCESCLTISGGYAVAGIGVNLLQDADFFQQAELPNGTSVMMVSGQRLTVEETAVVIINRLEPYWHHLCQHGFRTLRENYERRCNTIGREVRILDANGEILREGVAVGIAEDGQLMIESENKRYAVNAGEVFVRGLYGYI